MNVSFWPKSTEQVKVWYNVYCFERQGYRGRREERGRNLPSAGSLLTWPQCWGSAMPQPGSWSLIRVSHMDGRTPKTWATSTAFPAHQQGTGCQVEQPGLDLVPIWDAYTAGNGLTCAMVLAPNWMNLNDECSRWKSGTLSRWNFIEGVGSISKCISTNCLLTFQWKLNY